jgi:hypothetical protein
MTFNKKKELQMNDCDFENEEFQKEYLSPKLDCVVFETELDYRQITLLKQKSDLKIDLWFDETIKGREYR